MLGIVAVLLLAVVDEEAVKFADCPPAVRKAFQAEAKGVKIETVHKEKDEEDETVYWADVTLAGHPYAIGILEDGTLSEMNLAVEVKELPFEKCPAPVRETLDAEAFGSKIEKVESDRKYGVVIYEAVVAHKGKSYQLVVAEDGTLVEKVLVIEDEDVELASCPTAVKAAFHIHASGGTIGDVTKSAGIAGPVYEAEIEINGKVYLVEIDEKGLLISKSLEAVEEGQNL